MIVLVSRGDLWRCTIQASSVGILLGFLGHADRLSVHSCKASSQPGLEMGDSKVGQPASSSFRTENGLL